MAKRKTAKKVPPPKPLIVIQVPRQKYPSTVLRKEGFRVSGVAFNTRRVVVDVRDSKGKLVGDRVRARVVDGEWSCDLADLTHTTPGDHWYALTARAGSGPGFDQRIIHLV